MLSKRVEVTRAVVGICHMQVCAVEDATDEEILAACNEENPSGTTMGWSRVLREAEKGGAGPVDCADGGGRKHMLVVC